MANKSEFDNYLDNIIAFLLVTEFKEHSALSEYTISYHITHSVLGREFPFQEIQASFHRLSKSNYLSEMSDPFTPSYFSHRPELFEYYEDNIRDEGCVIWKCAYIHSWLKLALMGMLEAHSNKFSSEEDQTSPQADTEDEDIHDAANDYWEPLPIERDSIDYQEAVAQLENVLEVVRSNNGYAETEPEEREQMVWSLETGLEALQEPNSTLDSIKSLLLKPLNYLSKKFADASIGEAAKLAVGSIIKLFAGLL